MMKKRWIGIIALLVFTIMGIYSCGKEHPIMPTETSHSTPQMKTVEPSLELITPEGTSLAASTKDLEASIAVSLSEQHGKAVQPSEVRVLSIQYFRGEKVSAAAIYGVSTEGYFSLLRVYRIAPGYTLQYNSRTRRLEVQEFTAAIDPDIPDYFCKGICPTVTDGHLNPDGSYPCPTCCKWRFEPENENPLFPRGNEYFVCGCAPWKKDPHIPPPFVPECWIERIPPH